ncbi:MAG: FixH family protein [Acidimicrobiales bacterium]|nr:FixH family protein [Acidimicrobiales bacterium]
MGRALRSLFAVMVVTGVVLVSAGPSLAHGGNAVIEVLAAQPDGVASVLVQVRVTYEVDGHEAEGARVEVTVVDPASSPVSTTALASAGEPGVYAGSVPVPGAGSWQLEITSAFPPGTTALTVDVPAPPTTAPPTVSSTTAVPPTTGPAISTIGTDQALDPEAGDGGDSGFPWAVVVAVVALGGAGLVGVRIWGQRRRSSPPEA